MKLYIARDIERGDLALGMIAAPSPPCECHPTQYFEIDDAGLVAFATCARGEYGLPEQLICQVIGAAMLHRLGPISCVKH